MDLQTLVVKAAEKQATKFHMCKHCDLSVAHNTCESAVRFSDVQIVWICRPEHDQSHPRGASFRRSKVNFPLAVMGRRFTPTQKATAEDRNDKNPLVLRCCIRYIDHADEKDMMSISPGLTGSNRHIHYSRCTSGTWWLHDGAVVVKVDYKHHINMKPMLGFIYERTGGSRVE